MQEDTARQLARSPQYSAMRRILGEMQAHPLAWAFLQPVNGDEVSDYYTVIKNPMGEFDGCERFRSLLSFSLRLQHHGTQTRDITVSKHGFIHCGRAPNLTELQDLQPRDDDLREKCGEIREIPEGVDRKVGYRLLRLVCTMK